MVDVKELRKVFIAGGVAKGDIAIMFLQQNGSVKYVSAKTVEEADIVCIPGGEDVNPTLYGEVAIPGVTWNDYRDSREKELLDKAVSLDKFCVGICRGSQFINVYNGGKLWQDINCHAMGCKHAATDIETGEVLRVTSTHHQESRLAPEGKLLMYAQVAGYKQRYGQIVRRSNDSKMKDTEAFYYPETRMFGYQPHPEWTDLGDRCQTKFFEYIDRFFPLHRGEFKSQALQIPDMKIA